MRSIHRDKVAVITGGSRGIGFGIAQKLAAEGFDLVIIGRREESELKDLDELRKCGQKVFYCQGETRYFTDHGGKLSRCNGH
jgi:3-oxoacyl-[acyl-carrier protein] reductase